jgi:hydroxylysine kinase
MAMQNNSTEYVIQQMLTTTPPAFSATEAITIVASFYGIDASVHPLVSERDQNFRLDAMDGRRFTLKISNHAEQLQVVDFQNRALQHLEQYDATLPLPRVIPDLHGGTFCTVQRAGNTHFVRVLSWLDGMVLGDEKVSATLANQLGRLLARIGLALKDFEHPGANPPSLWDMKRASGLRDLLSYIEDSDLRQLISHTLQRFDSRVKPRLDTLRKQVIHNDLNPGNVLMDQAQTGQISGVIDFGDMVKSPLLIDLAVAAAYQLSDGDDPLRGALPMIAGYHAVCPLQDVEIELLTDLIRTRLITSLLIGSYRVSLFPENREYLMISHKPAIHYLTNLQSLSENDAVDRIRSSCASA